MSSQNLTISSAGYTQPYNGWTAWNPYREIYTGYSTVDGNTYACKLSFTIDSDLAAVINSINTLSISLVTSQTSNPGYTTAFLMNNELSPSECQTTAITSSTTGYIASGTCGFIEYKDVSSGTTVTYTFSGISLTAGTYHIYILRTGWKYYGFCAFTTPQGSSLITVNYIAKYTVTYNLNGGYTNLPSSQTKIEGTALTLSSTKPLKNDTTSSSTFDITGNANGGTPNSSITATKKTTQEWLFSHWNTKKDGTGTTYNSGASYTANANLVLYAQYYNSNTTYDYSNNTLSGLTSPTRSTDINATYKVTFNANGGSCDVSSLSANNTTLYSFANWNSKSSEDGTDYNSTNVFTQATTVYAKWNRATSTASITLPTPTRNGYDFLGWSTSASDESGITGNYTPSANITLYALWKAKGLIRLNINGEIREALVYVYHSSKYNQSVPMVHNDGEFKISG